MAASTIETVVSAALPDQPFAPTWCAGWFSQRDIRNPSAKQIARVIEIYRKHFGFPELRDNEMGVYSKAISEATKVTDPAMLAEIEDVMRNEVFHSTLDWQSKREFNAGARLALKVIQYPEAK